MIKIGIDPPHGMALARDGYIMRTKSVKYLADMFLMILEWSKEFMITEVVIEIPHGLGTRLGKGMPVNVQRKISANIGQVYQSALAIQAYCQTLNLPTRMQKSCKWLTKLKADRFAKITGYYGKTNEHERDAACLLIEN